MKNIIISGWGTPSSNGVILNSYISNHVTLDNVIINNITASQGILFTDQFRYKYPNTRRSAMPGGYGYPPSPPSSGGYGGSMPPSGGYSNTGSTGQDDKGKTSSSTSSETSMLVPDSSILMI